MRTFLETARIDWQWVETLFALLSLFPEGFSGSQFTTLNKKLELFLEETYQQNRSKY